LFFGIDDLPAALAAFSALFILEEFHRLAATGAFDLDTVIRSP
jgi:hypothetical protein